MNDPDPTSEQEAALHAFATGGSIALTAGAGTGKTSTLKMMAKSAPRKTGLYFAYNKAIAEDAKRRFPYNVTCTTAHGLAYRALGHRFKDRLNGPRLRADTVAQILGVTGPLPLGDGKFLPSTAVARVAMETVQRFCFTDAPALTPEHVPQVNGVEDQPMFASVILPLARLVWKDAQSATGRLRYQHDYYLKAWSLTRPTLDFDFLLLDEAQDANACVASVFLAQKAQKIAVGDAMQAIYGWRNAVDFLSQFKADYRLPLSESFRFGQPVADEANKWLTILSADMRLTGRGGPSRVGELDAPDAVLCRTNAEAVGRVLAAMNDNVQVALVGGGEEMKRLAEAARDLQAHRTTHHPELVAFRSWEQVQEYVQTGGGGDLKTFVKLIDQYGPDTVIRACEATVPEASAKLIVSTAHRSKGREWPRVQIAADFEPPDPSERVSRSEAMLAYVAVTRARTELDAQTLRWIEQVLHAPHRWPVDADGRDPKPGRVASSAAAPVAASAVPPTGQGAMTVSVTLPPLVAEGLREVAENHHISIEQAAEYAIKFTIDRLQPAPMSV